jgi:alanine dehydrogenase
VVVADRRHTWALIEIALHLVDISHDVGSGCRGRDITTRDQPSWRGPRRGVRHRAVASFTRINAATNTSAASASTIACLLSRIRTAQALFGISQFFVLHRFPSDVLI